MPRLILASTSPYRRNLLSRFGLDFESRSPQADERVEPGESPADMALRLAAAKALSVRAPDAVVIGADQVPSLDGQVLRKPGTHEAALQQLLCCQGSVVSFFTAVTVLDAASERRWQGVDRTDVTFASLTPPELETYLRIEQPYDCAGGFKAEGLGIVLFERISSDDPTALLGLPLIWLARTLRAAGLNPLAT
jgi:septum formation protein